MHGSLREGTAPECGKIESKCLRRSYVHARKQGNLYVAETYNVKITFTDNCSSERLSC